MLTRVSLLTVALLCFPSLLCAQRPHDWSYLEGGWQFESSNGYKAQVEYEIVAGGAAAIGRWSDKDGGRTIETIGWLPDAKSMLSVGFGTGGKYWRREYTQISKDKCHGPAVYIDPNGTKISGTSTLKRVNPDLVTGEMLGKTQNGDQVKMSVKFIRDAKDVSNE